MNIESHAKGVISSITVDKETMNHLYEPGKTTNIGNYSLDVSVEKANHSSAIREEPTQSVSWVIRDEKTHESVKTAEERRWECRYHLVDNENNRLRKDLDEVNGQLQAVQEDMLNSE